MIVRDIVYTFAAVLTNESVKKCNELTLQLKGLPLGNQEIKSTLEGGFFDGSEPCEVRSANVNLVIKVQHNTPDIIVLDMAIDGELTIPCDRCLDDMTHHVDTTYHLSVKAGERLDDSQDNVLEVPSSWKELDLTPIVRDTVLLTIPIMHTHDDPEQCNPEMMATLLSHEAHDADGDSDDATGNEHDPRWDALRQLTEK